MTDKDIPKWAIFRGRKVRVSRYEDGRFWIVDTDDSQRSVNRSQLTFTKK